MTSHAESDGGGEARAAPQGRGLRVVSAGTCRKQLPALSCPGGAAAPGTPPRPSRRGYRPPDPPVSACGAPEALIGGSWGR
eukprot:11993701-Alexandrium_andersonii.AAC.1